MFGLRRSKSLRDEQLRPVLDEIERGTPITPKHAQAARIDQDGFLSCISDTDREAFSRTRRFGVEVNQRLSWGGWRLQEKPRTLLSGFDDPVCGRRFDVFYNAHRAGELSIYARPALLSDRKGLCIALEINDPQLFPYDSLRSFLRLLTLLLADTEASDAGERELSVDRALQAVLWEVARTPEGPHLLEFRADGKATRFFG